MILSDWDIKVYLEKKLLAISPLYEDTVRENGVDLRFGNTFCRFKANGSILDSKLVNVGDFLECVEVGDEGFVINPHEHVLATTLEWVEMPIDLVGLVNLRSTFARLNLFIPPTVIDAGF
ncbi:MAG: dCTP deaminase, partial [Thermosphaera sp.]